MSDVMIRWGSVDVEDAHGHRRKEPAMGITRAAMGKQPMFAIPLGAAWKYTDPDYLIKQAFQVASHLQMFPDRFLINRIADLIMNYLPDLVRAKPPTEEKGRAFAEGIVRIDGEEIERFEAYTGGGIEK